MPQGQTIILLGSAPSAVILRDWQRPPGCVIVAINNAWRIRDDWDVHISPDDFPADRMPVVGPGQVHIASEIYVPANNAYGGIVYAGGTMAFSAGYWVLHALRPRAMVMVGCDMIYPTDGLTHFYGKGTPDPLRSDITLRSLEGKSARLMLHAARQGCSCVRAPLVKSRLVCPAVSMTQVPDAIPAPVNVAEDMFNVVKRWERRLDYDVPSGRYWTETDRFVPEEIDKIDIGWKVAAQLSMAP